MVLHENTKAHVSHCELVDLLFFLKIFKMFTLLLLFGKKITYHLSKVGTPDSKGHQIACGQQYKFRKKEKS